MMDAIVEEQLRLRKAEGKKPSYSALLRRMWEAYKQTSPQVAPLRVATPLAGSALAPETDQEREFVEGLLRFMRDRNARDLQEVLAVLLRPWLGKDGKKRGLAVKKNIA